MGKDCSLVLQDVVQCLSDSDCVKNHPNRKTALKDCAASGKGDVPSRCFELMDLYNQCWTTNVDPRRRIRGPPNFDASLSSSED
mmetsp:Transcript_1330/g.2071  ORF Transcript_1330/g.2071 Transcript_1330/m.2071 type:complete len:84 (-) Transcript_1330:652-903(-)